MSDQQNDPKPTLDILCLIDRNATMDAEETMGMFNAYLETLQEQKDDTQIEVSLVLFGENVEWLCRTMPVEYAKPLTEFTYTPMGNAALNDSAIKALRQFQDIKKQEDRYEWPTAVFMLTNGAENWSSKFTQGALSNEIKKLADEGWHFAFPNVDPRTDQHQVEETQTLREVGGVLDIVCVLDRSGSMSGIQQDVLGGYNSFIERMRKERRARVTTVQFDTQYEVLYKDLDIEQVPELTKDVYWARGGTALYDAVGQALGDKSPAEGEKLDRVILIVTDGAENSSREVTYAQVQKALGEQEDHGAKIIYLASNITQRDVLRHTNTAKALNVGRYAGAVGTVPAAPAINPQVYAQSYSCPTPNIQSFLQPAPGASERQTVMKSVFNAAFETCAGYPVSAKQQD